MIAHIPKAGEELQSRLPGQLGNKSLVRVRLGAAQSMIEMRDGQHDANLLPQLQQHAQQRHRIGPTRHSDPHAIARAHQLLLANILENLFAHRVIIALRVSLFAVRQNGTVMAGTGPATWRHFFEHCGALARVERAFRPAS